jgi:activator of HSP90 ATPase
LHDKKARKGISRTPTERDIFCWNEVLMRRAIQQYVDFLVSPQVLYKLYMDSKMHSEVTGSPAKVSRKVGGSFTAFDGALRGTNLLLVPDVMIVQAWRAAGWRKEDQDSILVMKFSQTNTGSRVDLVHVNVPESDYDGVSKGWKKYYWDPWRAYLGAKQDERTRSR